MRENNSIERLLCQEIRSDCNFKISIFLFNFELYHIATTNWFYSRPRDIFQLKELLERGHRWAELKDNMWGKQFHWEVIVSRDKIRLEMQFQNIHIFFHLILNYTILPLQIDFIRVRETFFKTSWKSYWNGVSRG